MEINTKFEIGQKVWILFDNEIQEKQIKGIEITCGKVRALSGGIRIRYYFEKYLFADATIELRENEIYVTKEELLKSI